MKRKKPGSRWMVVLMISSQVVLTAFMAYWIVNRFRAEREELRSELRQEFLAGYDQMLDSVLLEKVVAPAMEDSIQLTLEQLDPDSLERRSIVEIHMDENSLEDTAMFDTVVFRSESSRDMMVRSVRLFISRTGRTIDPQSESEPFSVWVDSASVLPLMKERFGQKGWNFTLLRVGADSGADHTSSRSGTVLLRLPGANTPAFRVGGYTGYIFREMVPQFLFALTLLLLSASALWITYRSYRKQWILAMLREEFMANISHELQTPVSTVKVALESMTKYHSGSDPRVYKEYLEMASHEVDRLGALVGRVLQHSLLEDTGENLQLEPCSLDDLAGRVLQSMEIHAKEKGAVIRYRPPEERVMAKIDVLLVESVVANLIDNSLKYAGPTPEIHVEISGNRDSALLRIRDNGPGIPEEYRSKIFDKFFRVPSGNIHNMKGYGLGLSFARQVMNKHHGRITQRNVPGGGCEFSLQFPTCTP